MALQVLWKVECVDFVAFEEETLGKSGMTGESLDDPNYESAVPPAWGLRLRRGIAIRQVLGDN